MQARRRRVILKSPREIDTMAEAGRHTAEILKMMCDAVEPGMSTWDLDQIARKEIKKRKITSAFLDYYGYPAVICASVNEEIVHGIPRKSKKLKDGDIIGIDFGVVVDGYVGDSARTICVGNVSREMKKLVKVTKECLDMAIKLCTTEHRLSDIGRTVQDHAESFGYGVVRDFVGHGIGTKMHEEPQVPNYYEGPRARLKEGLVIAIEPMINIGEYGVKVLDDGWTAITSDGEWSAHFEDTIAITDGKPRVLTRP